MKYSLLLLTISILIISCGKQKNESAMYDIAADYENEFAPISFHSPVPPPTIPDKIKDVIKKKIIKDGKIDISVKELSSCKMRIDSIIKKYDGYYANESFNNSDWESSYTLKIRIPCLNFENFIIEIENGEGEIINKEIDARDVTDEFIDLESRLENKRNYLKRYNDLLSQANNVKEILEIEEKIRVLEEEIESATGRLKYLGDLVDYSTLNLSITKPKDFKYNPANRDKFSESLKQSLSKGWYGFIDVLLFMIKIWPLWIFVFVIIFFWKRYKAKKKLKT